MTTKERVFELRKEKKSYGEIAKILKVNKSTVKYHCKKLGIDEKRGESKKLSNEIILNIREYYKTHELIETAKKFNVNKSTVLKYCDTKRIKLSEKQKKEHNYAGVKKRINNLKKMGVEYKGGKCIKCGYNKSVWALEYHHRNPKEKDFAIGSKPSIGWEKLKKELDKCDLVCANCHREIHHNEHIE